MSEKEALENLLEFQFPQLGGQGGWQSEAMAYDRAEAHVKNCLRTLQHATVSLVAEGAKCLAVRILAKKALLSHSNRESP
ncbi:hypothetical protein LJC56_00570 [Christensenellaceae bacterium OttesenSCG-928-K19]|nr:hypothetical protein [Christensenellaceae bacterium OttesenSCG-928-K19]